MRLRAWYMMLFLLLPLGARPGDPPLPVQVEQYPLVESLEQARKDPGRVFRLKLRRAGLKRIPSEIWDFPNLLELDLSHNKIRQIPDSLGNLRHLRVLNLSFNKITEIPPQIGELRELQQLLAYHNRIQGLPSEIGRLDSLTHLDLWYNEIGTLPDSLSRLRHLQELDLRGMILSQGLKDKVRAWLPETKVFTAPDCNCLK